MKTRRKPRFGSGEIIILIIIGLLTLIVVTDNWRLILNKLYSGQAALIVVVMLVEYLLLKGSDRTALYRRELDAARQKRRDDLLALRDMETQLVELRARLAQALEGETEAPPPLRETLEQARQAGDQLLTRLRERI